jgi:hypothetical protein
MSDYLAVAQQVLPHSQDEENLHNNFIMLVARTITSHIPYYQEFNLFLPQHTPHQFSEQMALKSETV